MERRKIKLRKINSDKQNAELIRHLRFAQIAIEPKPFV